MVKKIRMFNEGEDGENKPAPKLSPEEMAKRILEVSTNRATRTKASREKDLKDREAKKAKRLKQFEVHLAKAKEANLPAKVETYEEAIKHLKSA